MCRNNIKYKSIRNEFKKDIDELTVGIAYSIAKFYLKK